jgi:hypothetical protein
MLVSVVLKVLLVAVLVVLVAATGLPLAGMMGHGSCGDCASMATSGLCLAFLALPGMLLVLTSLRSRVNTSHQPALVYGRTLYRPPRLP